MPAIKVKAVMEDSPHDFSDAVEYRILMYEIMLELQRAERFFDVYDAVEEKLKVLLHSERVLVFKRGRHQRELSASVRIGDSVREVRLDFSPDSLAGYVALTQKRVAILDVADSKALAKIHPGLQNNALADKTLGLSTRSTIAVPIFHGDVLIGVLQLLNPDPREFSTGEFHKLKTIASMLGDHFFEELGVTEGPYDLLIRKGVIKREQLSELGVRSRAESKSIAHLLLKDFRIPRQVVGESLTSFYQVPFAEAGINAKVPAKLIQNINPNYVRQQGWVPIAENGQEVTVLIDDPSDGDKVMVIEQLFRGRKIKLLLMIPEEIAELAEGALHDNTDATDSIEELTDLAADEIIDSDSSSQVEDTSDQQQNSNVVRLLNKLIADAYTTGASDIHIQPAATGKPATVLFRIDGVCKSIARIPYKLVRPVVSRLKVMCAMDLAERRLPQDGKCTVKLRGQTLEIRVVVIPNSHGLESAVMRLLSNCEAMHLYGLNLSDVNLAEVKRLAEKPHGLFLVVGPTGSGKTTSLHSIVGHLNTGERIIWTIEDPVEITQPGLQQVSVNKRTGLTFATALRSFLRADPDVILVGEMRDDETAQIAVQASMTGHIVLSTLHTNSAAETINRLRSMSVESFDLADALLGILSQRLVRVVCAACSQPTELTVEEREFLQLKVDAHGLAPISGDAKYMCGPGCEACSHTGYQGRVGIHELLVASPAVKELIAAEAASHEIVEQSQKEGSPSFVEDAMQKLFSGRIDFREFRKAIA